MASLTNPIPLLVDRFTDALQRALGTKRPEPETPIPAGSPYGQAEVEGPSPEYGWGGTNIFGGVVAEEFNPDLRGKAYLTTCEKMRRTSGQVRAAQTVIGLPIRATVWYVEPPKNPGSAEKEAGELLQENLFGGMESSWDDLIREGMLAAYVGFRVPEICWEEQRGLISIRKIASRNPALIERWLYHADGLLAGYLYTGNRPVGAGLSSYNATVTKYERLPIPIEKTLHFIHEEENENPQGFGLARSMYPHWFIVQSLYKILNIGIERNLLGTPYGFRTPGAATTGNQEAAKKALLSILQRLRAADGGAFTLPDGWEVGFLESQKTLMDAMPYVHHHDIKILQACLVQFLNLGQQAAGTQALATVHAKLFEQAEEAHARWLEQTINSQLVARWSLLNYGPNFRYPKVRHKPIRSQDLAAWALALTQFLSAGVLHGTPDDEVMIRDQMELPDIEKDQLQTIYDEEKARSDAASENLLKSGAGGGSNSGDQPADTGDSGAGQDSGGSGGDGGGE